MIRISLVTLYVFTLSMVMINTGFSYINVTGTAGVPPALITKVQSEFLKYQSQSDLARGIANASAYSAHAVSQRGYLGFDSFAITMGGMIGFQPSSTSVDFYNHFGNELRDRGDAEMGVVVNVPTIQVSWHATPIMNSLYIGIRFGYIDYAYNNWQFNVLTLGLPVSYQLVDYTHIASGNILWRGLSINSGVFYQSNKIKYYFNQDQVSDATYSVEPAFTITAEATLWIIPFEITTGIRFLWVFNISAGAGIDFVFGISRLTYDGDPIVYLSGNPFGKLIITGEEPGKTPKAFMPKLVASVGFNFDIIILDVPFAYYYLDRGFSVGITVGFLW